MRQWIHGATSARIESDDILNRDVRRRRKKAQPTPRQRQTGFRHRHIVYWAAYLI
jgi:hypothetical protein